MYTGLFDRVTIHARKDFLGRVVGYGMVMQVLTCVHPENACSCYLRVFDTMHLVIICYQTLEVPHFGIIVTVVSRIISLAIMATLSRCPIFDLDLIVGIICPTTTSNKVSL